MVTKAVRTRKQQGENSLIKVECPACHVPLGEAFLNSLVEMKLAEARRELTYEIRVQERAQVAADLTTVREELARTKAELEQSRVQESAVLALRRRLQDELDHRELENARMRDRIRREERAQAQKVAEAKAESKLRDELAKNDNKLQAEQAANIALRKDLRERENQIQRLKRNARLLSQTAAAGPRRSEEGIALQEVIYDKLRERFPDDEIEVINRFDKGADYVQSIIADGRQCGKIVWEVTDAKIFPAKRRLAKIRADVEYHGATIGVIVASSLPSRMEGSGLLDGDVPICDPTHWEHLCWPLRQIAILKSNSVPASTRRLSSNERALYEYHARGDFSVLLTDIIQMARDAQKDVDDLMAFLTLWSQRWKARFVSVMERTLRLLGPIMANVPELRPIERQVDRLIQSSLLAISGPSQSESLSGREPNRTTTRAGNRKRTKG